MWNPDNDYLEKRGYHSPSKISPREIELLQLHDEVITALNTLKNKQRSQSIVATQRHSPNRGYNSDVNNSALLPDINNRHNNNYQDMYQQPKTTKVSPRMLTDDDKRKVFMGLKEKR